MLKRYVLAILLLTSLPLTAQQLEPAGSDVTLYFPHITVGGTAIQKWTTVLTFSNPHTFSDAYATVYFFGDDGNALKLDFGSGPVDYLDFELPHDGTITFETKNPPDQTVTGWAMVLSNIPLQGIVQIRYTSNAQPGQGLSAPATPASKQFRTPVTANTGIALANPWPWDVEIPVSILDESGQTRASKTFPLAPLAHKAFNIAPPEFPTLTGDFRGSAIIGNLWDEVVVWAVSADGSVLANYPPANLAWPRAHYDLIWKVWSKLLNEAYALGAFTDQGQWPDLEYDYTVGPINAYAVPGENLVRIHLNASELISDSDSELAYILGHALAHAAQARIGQRFDSANQENDADMWALELALAAGYDPYGAAGALGKLSMAATAGLLDPNFDNLQTSTPNLAAAFITRLGLLGQNINTLCNSMAEACDSVYYLAHPEFPLTAPLRGEAGRPAGTKLMSTPARRRPDVKTLRETLKRQR